MKLFYPTNIVLSTCQKSYLTPLPNLEYAPDKFSEMLNLVKFGSVVAILSQIVDVFIILHFYLYKKIWKNLLNA